MSCETRYLETDLALRGSRQSIAQQVCFPRLLNPPLFSQIRTYQRKYVDWEIKATLDKQHGLFGIVLPTHIQNQSGQIIVPDRFNDNVNSGYAVWTHWHGLTVQRFTELLNASIAKPTLLIDNSRAMRQRNG